MKMIELHYAAQNSTVWINVETIVSIERISYSNLSIKDHTQIDCIGDSCYCVKETPDEIKMLLGLDIIKYHSVKDKKTSNRKSKRRFNLEQKFATDIQKEIY